MIIPVSDAVKTKVDVIAVGGGAASFFKLIPWPEISAFLVCVYTALRIIEWAWDRWKK
jgi:hypothetical protein